ncbi:MAG TPA: magnesium transporter [Thermomicrobiales bacterium]|nr:magnesium transporter [Thermomicrobiales bacterium]
MTDQLVEDIRRALVAGTDLTLDDVTGELSPAEWARILSRLPAYEMVTVAHALPASDLPDIVADMRSAIGADLVERMQRPEAAALLEAMDPDDATDIVARLDDDVATQLLGAMAPGNAQRIRQLLVYPADTAGGRMTPEFLALRPELTADEAIAAIRLYRRDAETPYYIYVVDGDGQFRGVLSLHELVMASGDTPVRELMQPETVSVTVDTDQEEAARLLTRRNLLALPVIDHDDHLVGIITEDDVADVIEEETTEDFERIGGSQPLETPYRHASILLLFRKRIVWLLALFVAEAYTGSVMRFFEDTLDQVVALSFFIPLLLGTGGNVGSQITTTLVRAMAVEELTLRDLRWILGKEFAVGMVIGVVMAVIAYVRAELLHVGSDVSTVIAFAIAAISIWSSIVAAVLPLMLRKFRFDPTVVSAPFITTLVDGTGLVIYFMIAKSVLGI